MQLTVCDLRDLAKGNSSGCGPNLGLTVAESGDNRGGNNLGPDNLSVANFASVAATLHDQDLDWRALRSPGPVVEVEKVTACALIEDCRAAECE